MNVRLWFAVLGVCSSLSFNLILQFGLGMGAASSSGEEYRFPFIQTFIVFVSVLLLWPVFVLAAGLFSLGIFEYILIFPMSALICFGLEHFISLLALKGGKMERTFSASTAYDGLAAAALFITLNLAERFSEAVLLAFGFALGILASLLMLAEIRRRASMEAVPRFLRGSPLILVSMGLLSLIFSSAAAVLFKVLGAG
jgi:electron transport complex protein RnfA